MDLIDIFRTFHPNAEYTFFSSVYETFSRIDYILGQKPNLSKFKKIVIISSIFSDHSIMRLDIHYKNKTAKNTNTWRLNNTFLYNQQVFEEIKRKKFFNFWKQMTVKTQLKTYAMQQNSSKREVYSNTIISQEARKNIE